MLLAFFKNFDTMTLRNVADFSFKKGSRIFKQRAPSSHLFSKSLNESAPPPLAPLACPAKNVLRFSDFARGWIFSKKERTFFFGVLPSKYSGSAWGFNTDEVLAKLFSGDLDLAKPRLHFPPAERGLGNECGRVSSRNFDDARLS